MEIRSTFGSNIFLALINLNPDILVWDDILAGSRDFFPTGGRTSSGIVSTDNDNACITTTGKEPYFDRHLNST